ncbi:MAG: DVU0298 family protein, partial [Desulfotomaculales bacterium]
KIVTRYDYETNLVVPGGFYEGRKISGALYFVRLHDDVREVTQEGVRRRLAEAEKTPLCPPAPPRAGKPLSKEEVEKLVENYAAAPLLGAAARDPGVLGKLQRLLYAADAQKRRRAAEFLGLAGAAVAAGNPRAVARLLQTLFSSLEDTGSSGWGTIEAIGEVIAATGGAFAGYVPVLYQVLEDRAQEKDTPSRVLHALGRIAGESPALITKPFSSFTRYLSDPRPAVRGQAVYLLGNLNPERAKVATAHLAADEGELEFYEKGEIVKKTVGELVARVLAKEDPPRPR